METIQINRNIHSMPEIEKMIRDLIAKDLGAKKVSVQCVTRNWQGHRCPEFKAKADGVKLLVFGDVDIYEMECIDPWQYSMRIHYTTE